MGRTLAFVLAMGAILAAVAFLGAGSAGATALCSTNTSPCSGTEYEAETPVEAVAPEATLTLGAATVTCPEVALAGKTTDSGGEGEVVGGTITSLSFGGECELSLGGTCTMEATSLPYTLDISAIEEGSGSVFVGYEAGIGVLVKCGFITCSYSAEEAEFDLSGGEPALVVAEEVPFVSTGGGGCPSTASLSAEFELAEPSPLFTVNDGIWIRSNPGNLNFGQVKTGTSKDLGVTIRYVGGKPTYLLSLFAEIFEGDKDDFIVFIENCKKPTEFPNGHTCTATIRFRPKNLGWKEAEIAIDEDSMSPRHSGIRAWGEGV